MRVVDGDFKSLTKMLKKKTVSSRNKFKLEIDREIKKIMNDSKKQADRKYYELLEKGLKKVYDENNNKIEEAEVLLRSSMLRAEQESFLKFMELLREKLVLFRQGKILIARKKYNSFLKKTYESGREKIGDKVIVYCNPKDKTLVKKLLKPDKVISEDLLGGIIMEDGARTIRVDKSFDKLIKDKEHEIQQKFLEGLK